jgi:hypothetical protein
MYKVAVMTQKKTNPFIKPYLILDGEEDYLTDDLISLGVTIIKHRCSFYNDLERHYAGTIAFGAFLRIDLPIICQSLNINEDYILYTDNDVMFIKDVSKLKLEKPKYFSATGEFNPQLSKNNFNSGVLWINWRNMLRIHPDFVEWIKNNLDKLKVFDQDALKIYFENEIDEFHHTFNYKPYWPKKDNIKILHFHGPKPTMSDSEVRKYEHSHLLTSYFFERREKFNQILNNLNL